MNRFAWGVVVAMAPVAASAAPETYTLDPYHTFVHFGIEHNELSTIWGRFDRSSGKFTMDPQAKAASLEVVVETASVTTGDSVRGNRPRSRDEHLRSADFFNTAEFPRMVYKAGTIRFNGDAPAEIRGELTLLGVTRPLTLAVDRWKCVPHRVLKRPVCGGNATGALKRSDFGMKWGIPATGDDVRIMITFEAIRD